MIKKTLSVLIILIVVIALSIYLYFKYWHEPEAKYVETDSAKLISIRKDVNELKAELRRKGAYACCIKGDCNWCALYMEHCPCADLVSKKGSEKSCPECAAAWNRKQGKIPGIDPDAIQVTTFGIYGYEEGGHHNSDSMEQDADTKHTQERSHGEHNH